jgi:hypothetical protein
MNRWIKIVIVTTAIAVVLIPMSAQGHILKLKDGRIIMGEFVSATKDVVRFRVEEGTIKKFPIDDILSIHFSMASISAPPQAAAEPIKIIPGTVVRVRTASVLSTTGNNAGDRFFAKLDRDLVVDGNVLSPKGKRVYGRVRKVVKPKRAVDKAVIELVLTDLTIEGKTQPIITDYFGVQNDGHGTVNVLGSARAPETTIPQFMDGKNLMVPKNTLFEFRITQPVSVRGVAH